MVPAAIRAALGIPGRPVPTADPTTSELLRLYGDQLLTLAGFPPRGPVQSLQSKLAQTTRVPDGLLQVDPTEPGARPEYYLCEIASYATSRVPGQMLDDLALALGACAGLPEAIVFLLNPHSREGLQTTFTVTSPRGSARLSGEWWVVRVYEMDAQEILGRGLVGLAPLALVAQTALPPTELAQQVRALVDQAPEGGQHANLLPAGDLSGAGTVPV